MTRDAVRFPELARRYQDEFAGARNTAFSAYFDKWLHGTNWSVKDKAGASEVFAALLKVGLFDQALHGLTQPTDEDLVERAGAASVQLLHLLQAGLL